MRELTQSDSDASGLGSWAAWWAAIANITDVSSIAKIELSRLFDAYMMLCSTALNPELPEGFLADFPDAVRKEVWQSQQRPDPLATFFPPDAAETIRGAIDRAREIIHPLFEGGASGVLTAPYTGRAFMLTPNGYVAVSGSVRSAERFNGYDIALWHLLQPGRLFPIRQCLRKKCGTFFEAAGAKKFCSRLCQSQERDDKRTGTPARQAVVRRAQKTWRDAQKEKHKTGPSKKRAKGNPRRKRRPEMR